MDCVDVSADVQTAGLMFVDGENRSIFEVCTDDVDSSFDTDWHAINLNYARTYLFTLEFDGTAPALQPTLTLQNRQGFEIVEFDDSSQLSFRHTARYSGTYFIDAFQGTLLNQTEYRVSVVEVQDDTRGDSPRIRLYDGFAKLDELELLLDTDTFDFEVFPGRTYTFAAYGSSASVGTLPDPAMTLRRGDQVLAFNDNGPNGPDPLISFTASQRETLQLEVSGTGLVDTGIGTYAVIGIVADEAPARADTPSELVFDANGLAVQQGYISELVDIDWHRVELEAGDIVRVAMRGDGVEYLDTPNLLFRDPSQNKLFGRGIGRPSPDNVVEYFYEVQETGTHYVVARTKKDGYNGAYEVSVEKIRTPGEAVNLFGRGDTARLLIEDSTNIPLADLLDTKGLTPFSYQVVSSIPLIRDGNVMSANQVYGILEEEIGLWSVQSPAGGVPLDGSIRMRARGPNTWSEWQKFALTDATFTDGLDAGRRWPGEGPITYRFVAERPDYYGASEFGDFQFVAENGDVGNFITSTFDSLNAFLPDRRIERAVGGAAADINIFAAADPGGSFLGYWPGDDRGGDLILKTSDFQGNFTDLQRTRLLQGLGSALGLKFVGGASLAETVMGSELHPRGLLPESWSADDWLALQTIYGSSLRDPEAGQTAGISYVMHATNDFVTVATEARTIIVGNDVADLAFNVDLRDRGRSFARDAVSPASEIYIAPGAQVSSGVGGNADDFLFGNGLENVLQGRGGNDFLTGHEKNDILIGGQGDDTYLHYLGDGDDFIIDEGGVDTLCFLSEGEIDTSRLVEDYVFSKNGQFLDVALTLDGMEREGGVRIDTGVSQDNLVERLELYHDGTLRARISLFAIWNDLADGQSSRFTASSAQDSFGNLVTPV